MIHYLQRNEIDSAKWDTCISNSRDGQVFAFTWYLDVCCPGWSALVLDDYTAVFPLLIRTKFGIAYTLQPFFTRHFGVFAAGKNADDLLETFFASMPGQIRYWDFCLHEAHRQIPEGYTADKKMYQLLDLNDNYSDIHNRYHENHKRNIRKAEKNHLQINPHYEPKSVAHLFRIHSAGKDLGFSDGDYKTLETLMHAAGTQVPVETFSVQDDKGVVQAGAFFIQSKERLLYLKGFSTPEGRKSGAMHFLFDQLIRSKSGQPLKLDFGGSNDPGVARFYQGFGSRDCLYLHLRKNRLPGIIRWLKP